MNGSRRVAAALHAAASGRRLEEVAALLVAAEAELPLLGLAAGERSRRDGASVGYVSDITVIYSTSCSPGCPYCPGAPAPRGPGEGILTPEDVERRAQEAATAGAVQVVLQGGHRGDLPWQTAQSLVRAARGPAGDLHVVAFSASELLTWSEGLGQPVSRLVADLARSGARVLPAAALDTLQPVRRGEALRLLSGPWPEWEEAITAAAREGVRVVATLPVGAGESPTQRTHYLLRVRALQDRLLAMGTQGFTSVVALPSGPETSGYEYLKALALARVILDNVPHVQASFLALGAKVAQVALGGGADDIGGLHLEAHGVSLAAGREGPMTPEEATRLIRGAGAEPVLRRFGET